MSTPTETLKHEASRSRLLGFVLLAVIVVLLVRFYLLPQLYPTLLSGTGEIAARVLESLAVALLTGLSIPALAIWLGPDLHAKELISILDRKLETTPAFTRALHRARSWYFRGGLGSYFRSDTLPTLLKQPPPIGAMVVMLDIGDPQLLKRYSEYRTALSGKPLSPEAIRAGVLSTIWQLACAVNSSRAAFTEARVSLVRAYSSFRIDMSDREVFLTQDNPNAPALRFDAESSFYKGFENEFLQAKTRSFDLLQLLSNRDLERPAEFFKNNFGWDLQASERDLLGA